MTVLDGALLVGAAVLGGALNAVAGGGSFFTFPALIASGVPSIPANATSTLALWPGSVASAAAYRSHLGGDRRRSVTFAAVSLVGGVLGAWILIHTPPLTFDRLLPFLLLVATGLFAMGPSLTRRLRERRERSVEGTDAESWTSKHSTVVSTAAQFAIAIYGGYFGGGMGMMMLAAFSVLGMEDIHRMNGLKAVLSVAINLVALITFTAAGIIHWEAGLLMTVGAVAGGYGGAALARRLNPKHVRTFITLVGVVMTLIFFARAFLPAPSGRGSG